MGSLKGFTLRSIAVRDFTLLTFSLVAIVPFNLAIASRANLVVYQLVMLGLFGLLFFPTVRQLPMRYHRLLFGLGLLLGWIVLSSFWGFNVNSALNMSFVYGMAVVLFISLLVMFESAWLRCFWLLGYLVVAAAAVIASLSALNDGNVGRIQVGLMLANSAAGFLLPAVVVVLFEWPKIKPWPHIQQIAVVILGLVILAGFFLTFSRGSFVCLAVISLFILGFKYSRWAAITVAVVLAFLLVGYVSLSNHVAKTASSNNQSLISRGLLRDTNTTLHDRKIYAKSALDLFRQYPFFGAGAGSYRVVAMGDQAGATVFSTNAHASILQFMSEFGLVGLGLLGYVSWQLFGFLKIAFRRQLIIVAAALALGLHFMIEIDLIYPPLVFLFASLMALAVSYSQLSRRPE